MKIGKKSENDVVVPGLYASPLGLSWQNRNFLIQIQYFHSGYKLMK